MPRIRAIAKATRTEEYVSLRDRAKAGCLGQPQRRQDPPFGRTAELLQLLHLDEMLHLEDHAADRVVVDLIHRAADLAQAQRAQRGELVFL